MASDGARSPAKYLVNSRPAADPADQRLLLCALLLQAELDRLDGTGSIDGRRRLAQQDDETGFEEVGPDFSPCLATITQGKLDILHPRPGIRKQSNPPGRITPCPYKSLTPRSIGVERSVTGDLTRD